MGEKAHTPEQIIHKLREVEVALSQGATVKEAAKRIGVTDHTYYRWRAILGRMAMANPSTASCGMSCSTGRCLTRSWKQRC